MAGVQAVTVDSFENDGLKSKLPVLVDFWAAWCGPCKMMASVVEEIARDDSGQIKALKLNTDENPNTASQMGIRNIPALILFKGGVKLDTVVGAVPESTLAATIAKYS